MGVLRLAASGRLVLEVARDRGVVVPPHFPLTSTCGDFAPCRQLLSWSRNNTRTLPDFSIIGVSWPTTGGRRVHRASGGG